MADGALSLEETIELATNAAKRAAIISGYDKEASPLNQLSPRIPFFSDEVSEGEKEIMTAQVLITSSH